MLEVENLEAWYSESKALHGLSFDVRKGEVVTLLGRNGAGKTTALKSIMGLLKKRKGSIRFEGDEIVNLPPRKVARKGIAICPEERGIFATLSVRENYLLPPVLAPGGMDDKTIHALFPNLADRANSPGTKLSGGEQQMLAIARILRTGARLLLLDEPSEGLAPTIVQNIARTITALKERSLTVVLVEQNFQFASSVADRHFLIESGKVVDSLGAVTSPEEAARIKRYLSM